MTATLQSLMSQLGPRLGLRWLTPEPTHPRVLPCKAPGQSNQSIVGSLNCIHPNCLQVIGHTEIGFLHHLSESARADTIAKLFGGQPVAILFSDSLQPLPIFHEHARDSGIPLLGSDLADEELINHLRYFLTHALAERTTLHGVFIEVLGIGVLLTGDPAVGKSELALELISRGHRLIADDAPRFARIAPETVEGTCPEMLKDFLEVRGLGILNIRAMFGEGAVRRNKTLNLVINLQTLAPRQIAEIDRLCGSLSMTPVLDVPIPTITMPVATGRNLAILVEAAVRNQALRLRGYDAGRDFIERQAQALRAVPQDLTDPQE